MIGVVLHVSEYIACIVVFAEYMFLTERVGELPEGMGELGSFVIIPDRVIIVSDILVGKIAGYEPSCMEKSHLVLFDVSYGLGGLYAILLQQECIFIGTASLGFPEPCVYDAVGQSGTFVSLDDEQLVGCLYEFYGIAMVAESLFHLIGMDGNLFYLVAKIAEFGVDVVFSHKQLCVCCCKVTVLVDEIGVQYFFKAFHFGYPLAAFWYNSVQFLVF